jgi:hypothetical protein
MGKIIRYLKGTVIITANVKRKTIIIYKNHCRVTMAKNTVYVGMYVQMRNHISGTKHRQKIAFRHKFEFAKSNVILETALKIAPVATCPLRSKPH